jgi:hypothetical protein
MSGCQGKCPWGAAAEICDAFETISSPGNREFPGLFTLDKYPVGVYSGYTPRGYQTKGEFPWIAIRNAPAARR